MLHKLSPSTKSYWNVFLYGDVYKYISVDETLTHPASQGVPIFGNPLEETKRAVVLIEPDYMSYFDLLATTFEDLVDGTLEHAEHVFPQFNEYNVLEWIQYTAIVTSRNEKKKALTMVVTTETIIDKESKMAEIKQLREENKNLRILNESAILAADIMSWRIDFDQYPSGEKFIGNRFTQTAIGLEPDEDGLFSVTDFMSSKYPDDEGQSTMENIMQLFQECIDNKRDSYTTIVKHRHLKTNQVLYLRHRADVISRHLDGRVKLMNGYNVDVTPQILMEQSFKQKAEKEKLIELVDMHAVRIAKLMAWQFDFEQIPDGDRFFGSDLLVHKFGLERDNDGYFKLADFASTKYPDDEGEQRMKKVFQCFTEMLNNERDSYSVIAKHRHLKTGDLSYFEHNAEVTSRYPDGRCRLMYGYNVDVTQQMVTQKRYEYLLKHDQMTGLLNRTSFEEFTKTTQFEQDYSIINIDIDGLKFVNDAFGHLVGDELIIQLGNLLKKAFPDDLVYRIGGDEFTVISTITDEQLLNNELRALRKSFLETKNPIEKTYSFSYGVELLKRGEKSFLDVFSEAENFMYRQKLNNRLSRKSKSIDLVMETLHQKTDETITHCKNVESYAIKLMKKVGFNRRKDIQDMKLLAKIHDIGKITISEEILNKPGVLSTEERKKIKKHSEAGYKITKNIVDSEQIALGVLQHHERIDGTGYPFGLKGQKISSFAKIIAIADAFDAMTSKRVYSPAMSKEEALQELQRNKGTQFDAEYTELFIQLMKEE